MSAVVVKPMTTENEYKKNPDISPDDIRLFREWLNTQPHLPGDLLTDVDLIIVYHCCQQSMGLSKQVLDLHYTLKTLFNQFFKDRSLDKKVEHAINTILYAPLPTSTVEGYRVVYLRLLDADPRSFNFIDGIKAFMMMFDLWQYEEGTWPGFVIIIDLDQAVLGHLTKLDIMVLKKALYFLQECMLTRLKAVHFLRAPNFMDKIMSLLKPFLKKELLDMLFIHQVGSESIYKQIPKASFPKEEGGEYKDHNTICDELIQRLQANSEFFKLENKRRVNEALRPGGKAAHVQELFGIQGSFKKLDID